MLLLSPSSQLVSLLLVVVMVSPWSSSSWSLRVVWEASWEKAGSRLVSVKLNLTDPCCTLYNTVPVHAWLRDARLVGWVTNCSICASTMPRAKTGLEKVQFYCEDDLLLLSSYYLSMVVKNSFRSDLNIQCTVIRTRI